MTSIRMTWNMMTEYTLRVSGPHTVLRVELLRNLNISIQNR